MAASKRDISLTVAARKTLLHFASARRSTTLVQLASDDASEHDRAHIEMLLCQGLADAAQLPLDGVRCLAAVLLAGVAKSVWM